MHHFYSSSKVPRIKVSPILKLVPPDTLTYSYYLIWLISRYNCQKKHTHCINKPALMILFGFTLIMRYLWIRIYSRKLKKTGCNCLAFFFVNNKSISNSNAMIPKRMVIIDFPQTVCPNESDTGPSNMLLLKHPQFFWDLVKITTSLVGHFDQVSKNCVNFGRNRVFTI